jgi:hypothetical protein
VQRLHVASFWFRLAGNILFDLFLHVHHFDSSCCDNSANRSSKLFNVILNPSLMGLGGIADNLINIGHALAAVSTA